MSPLGEAPQPGSKQLGDRRSIAAQDELALGAVVAIGRALPGVPSLVKISSAKVEKTATFLSLPSFSLLELVFFFLRLSFREWGPRKEPPPMNTRVQEVHAPSGDQLTVAELVELSRSLARNARRRSRDRKRHGQSRGRKWERKVPVSYRNLPAIPAMPSANQALRSTVETILEANQAAANVQATRRRIARVRTSAR